MNNYLVSVKYDFKELKKKDWIYDESSGTSNTNLPSCDQLPINVYEKMTVYWRIVRWIFRESSRHKSQYFKQAQIFRKQLLDSEDTYKYLDDTYYNNTLFSQISINHQMLIATAMT